jgi:PAS domain-containing protein
MIGRRISELYPALAGGELIDGYRQVVETGVPMTVEVMPYEDVIDGVPVAGFYTVQVSRFEDGVLVASRDITALETSRRDLESALHRLEETLQELEAAQRLAQLGTWRIDLATGAITMSSELQRRYASGPEVPDRLDGLAPWIHEDDADRARAGFDTAMRTHGPTVVEHRVRFADGSIGHVRSSIQPVVVDDRVVAMWGTTTWRARWPSPASTPAGSRRRPVRSSGRGSAGRGPGRRWPMPPTPCCTTAATRATT